jgi:hypothetical protein
MPATYEPISTTTLASGTASVTFSSIPSTYTDLVLIASVSAVSVGTDSIDIQFNSDTATNYSVTYINGNGTSATSVRFSNDTKIIGGIISSTEVSTAIWHIINYANTTTYKSALARGGLGSSYGVRQAVGLWRSTAAISTIKLYNDSAQNFAAGSIFTLYGIKAA